MATPTFFDGWLSDIQNEALMRPITKEGLLNTLHSFQAGESLGPDGWTVEFYRGFWDLIVEDLLTIAEDSWRLGQIHAPFNTTLIANIPKDGNTTGFEHYRPISFCNCIDNIISKVIAARLKPISSQKFGFLDNRHIHDAIGAAQEALHTMKSKARSACFRKEALGFWNKRKVKWAIPFHDVSLRDAFIPRCCCSPGFPRCCCSKFCYRCYKCYRCSKWFKFWHSWVTQGGGALTGCQ